MENNRREIGDGHSQQRVFQADSVRKAFCARIARQEAQALGFSERMRIVAGGLCFCMVYRFMAKKDKGKYKTFCISP